MPPFPPPRNSMAFSSQPGAVGAIARFWLRSYAADYVTLGAVAIGFVLIQLFITPFHRMFYLDNMAIQYPFAKVERVPLLWSLIYSGLLPAVFITTHCLLTRQARHTIHVSLLGLIASLMITPFVTDIIKNAVGRPRPDLISRCMPEQGTPSHKLVGFSVCTQSNEHILQEGWRSFPSGHSSFAFAGLGFLSLYLAGQMYTFHPPRADLARCLLTFLPVLGAGMIAISRTEDYRHDVWDVTAGAVLGACVGYTTYRRYFPAVTAENCHVPYDRAETAFVLSDGFGQIADDEEMLLSSSPGAAAAGGNSPS